MIYKPLLDWMKERQDIWVRRNEQEPPPWSKDIIFQKHKFCNVFRELDIVTIWIRKNIREPFADHPNLWFMLAIARRLNHPSSLSEIIVDKKGAWPLEKYNPERMMQLLDDRVKRKEVNYTGAFFIPMYPYKAVTNSHCTAFSLNELWLKKEDILPKLNDTLELAFNAILRQAFGYGHFMTYELITDLRHTRYLKNASDIDTWANIGPGSNRGLNRLHGRRLNQLLSHNKILLEMQEALAEVRKDWPSEYPILELRDIEHSLCEVDKYLRILNKEGTGRRWHPKV